MVRRSNTKTAEIKPDLQVTKPVKTTAYNDINLNEWKDYDFVKTDTLWEFPSRLKEGGHSNEYHGNYIPQIAQQIYERFRLRHIRNRSRKYGQTLYWCRTER